MRDIDRFLAGVLFGFLAVLIAVSIIDAAVHYFLPLLPLPPVTVGGYIRSSLCTASLSGALAYYAWKDMRRG